MITMEELSTAGRRERKKLATQLIKQQGFYETSMEQIAEHSDVSKGTLYKYFAVKEAIIAAYWQEEIKNSQEEFQQIFSDHKDTRSRLEAMYGVFMSRIMDNRELYEIYISYRMQHLTNTEINEKLRSGVADNAAAIIVAGQESGEIRKDLPLNLLVGNLEMLSVMQAMAWLRNPAQFSIEASSKLFIELFLNGAANHATL
jgi:AcrR family transcriptional regulator